MLVGCGDSSAPGGGAVPEAEPGGLALVGGQLIDGTGAPPVADSVVVIRDGRIESAGPRDTTAIPDGAETLDMTGKSIMPGLVNLHVHYREGPAEIQRQFASQLYYGVTTARSIGSDSPERTRFLLESAGRPDFPRTFTAGLGFSRPGRLQRRRPECARDRRGGAGAGPGPDRARRALHQDVGQRGPGAGPEDHAGDPDRHHRRGNRERRDPCRPYR